MCYSGGGGMINEGTFKSKCKVGVKQKDELRQLVSSRLSLICHTGLVQLLGHN